jgi:hypothetical protein
MYTCIFFVAFSISARDRCRLQMRKMIQHTPKHSSAATSLPHNALHHESTRVHHLRANNSV